MKKILITAIGLLLAGSILSNANADESIKEGKWSVTVVVTATGLPQQAPPQSVTQQTCLNNKNPVPDLQLPPGCATPEIQSNAGTISFKVSCDTKAIKMTTSGKITYSGDTMDGSSTSEMTAGEVKINSTAQISGKYLGPCE